MGYTRTEIIEQCKRAFQNKDLFYKEDFVNYRGVTADTKEYYTEVVAEFLCDNIDVYVNGIQCISRISSYRNKAHEEAELSGSNREEENIAKKIYIQSQEHGPFDHIGAILDYQTPLKAKADDKAGKIDLLSFDGKAMHILELKKPASEETMLRCVLEGFTYLKTVDTKKLISDFGYDPEGVEVKASPFVFCGSDQCSEMLQDRPFLRELMRLLDSKPYYIAGQDMYTVIEDVIPGTSISGNRTYDMTVRNRMQAKYPEELLGGSFRGRAYGHIFKNLKDNFVDGKYPEKKCLKGELTDGKIKYHYAEHLNSSQAMCIGYFKKFFETASYEKFLTEILTNQGIDIAGNGGFTDAIFEYVPDAKEGTNFDFYLKMADGRQLTWEIKFTESEFGKTTKQKGEEDRYSKKYEEVYVSMLKDCAYYRFPSIICDSYQCLETGALTNNCCVYGGCKIHEFYEHYQIRRNILYAKHPGDYVLFLTPRENKSLDKEREYIEQYAKKWGTECIRNVYWEDLLDTTLQVVSNEPVLLDYYTKFKEKYFE